MKTRKIDRPFQVKSVQDDGTFVGYGSVFGELDSYRDIVMPGAFRDSLQNDFDAKGRMVPMLWQHDMRNPIGVYPTIREDNIGLYVEGQCNLEVRQGRECHSLMKQGALTGLSIGFTTVADEWDEANLVRKITKVNLWEVSPVTFPAADSARVNDVKSIEGLITLSDVEDYLRDAGGFTRREAVALVARIKAAAPQSDSALADDSVKKAIATLKSISL